MNQYITIAVFQVAKKCLFSILWYHSHTNWTKLKFETKIIIILFLFKDIVPAHWTVTLTQTNAKIEEKPFTVRKIVIHPYFRSNAPTFDRPSDYDVGKLYASYKFLKLTILLFKLNLFLPTSTGPENLCTY